jgi:hypothetical protein
MTCLRNFGWNAQYRSSTVDTTKKNTHINVNSTPTGSYSKDGFELSPNSDLASNRAEISSFITVSWFNMLLVQHVSTAHEIVV